MTRPQNDTVTIRDVARRAGVSVATVSRYINQTAPVSKETSDRVHEAMAQLNYAPLSAARKLATRRNFTLGLLLTDMYGDFFGPLLSGIEAGAAQVEYDLLISSSRHSGSRKEFPLGPHNTDGLLVFAGGLSENGLAKLYEMDFPLVLIHQTPPAGMAIPCVTVENKAASRKVVEHLIEAHGRRRIVFLNGPRDHEDPHWREIGYRAALEAHDIPFDPALVAAGDFDRNIAHASLCGLMAKSVEIDAVFAGDDEASVGVLAALKEAGKRVPEDVAVAGFDDQRMAAYLTPPLTTVRAPTEEVGRIAVQQLVQRINNAPTQGLTLLPTEIVLRHSCGCG